MQGSGAPPFSLMPKQARPCVSGVPLDSAREGHSLCNHASITPGLAREYPIVFSFVFRVCKAGGKRAADLDRWEDGSSQKAAIAAASVKACGGRPGLQPALGIMAKEDMLRSPPEASPRDLFCCC